MAAFAGVANKGLKVIHVGRGPGNYLPHTPERQTVYR